MSRSPWKVCSSGLLDNIFNSPGTASRPSHHALFEDHMLLMRDGRAIAVRRRGWCSGVKGYAGCDGNRGEGATSDQVPELM